MEDRDSIEGFAGIELPTAEDTNADERLFTGTLVDSPPYEIGIDWLVIVETPAVLGYALEKDGVSARRGPVVAL